MVSVKRFISIVFILFVSVQSVIYVKASPQISSYSGAGTPLCRLNNDFNSHIKKSLSEITGFIHNRKDIDTSFLKMVVVNHPNYLGEGLRIEVISDADPGSVDAQGCIIPNVHHSLWDRDSISIQGICISKNIGKDNIGPLIQCSQGALKIVLDHQDPIEKNLVLSYLLAHEISHIGRNHQDSAFLKNSGYIELNKSPLNRLSDAAGYCTPDSIGRTQEMEADDDALWVLRILLDDLSAEGAMGIVPAERGGLGQFNPPDTVGIPGEIRKRPIARGRQVPAYQLIAPFRAAGTKLGEWERQFLGGVYIPVELNPVKVGELDRRVAADVSKKLTCDLISSSAQKNRIALPTLPGNSHQDGGARLSSISHAIDALGNFRAGQDAILDRQVAEYRKALAQPFCWYVNKAERLPISNNSSDAQNCELLDKIVPPTTCKPITTKLQRIDIQERQAEFDIETTSPYAVSINLVVTSAVMMKNRNLLIGSGNFSEFNTYIGMIERHQSKANLNELACTPTILTTDKNNAYAFCREPMSVVTIDAQGKPKNMYTLHEVTIDGDRVDGYIPGLLDKHGKEIIQTDKNPGQVTRAGIYLMKLARFRWAGNVDGNLMVNIDFPGGGNQKIPFHSSFGSTLVFHKEELQPLPVLMNEEFCTSIKDSWMVYDDSSQSRKYAVSAGLSLTAGIEIFDETEIVIRELDDKGENITSSYKAGSDATACTFSAHHNQIVCLNDSGVLFTPLVDGAQKKIASFSMRGTPNSYGFCSADDGLYAVTKVIDDGGWSAEHHLYKLSYSNGVAELLHRETETDNAGVNCNEFGVSAWFAFGSSSVVWWR